MTLTGGMQRRPTRHTRRSYKQLPFISTGVVVVGGGVSHSVLPSLPGQQQQQQAPATLDVSQKGGSEHVADRTTRKRKREAGSDSRPKRAALAADDGDDGDSPTFTVRSFYGSVGATEKLGRDVPRARSAPAAPTRCPAKRKPLREVPASNVLALAPDRRTATPTRPAPPDGTAAPTPDSSRRFFRHKASDRRRASGDVCVSMRKGFHLRYQPARCRPASVPCRPASAQRQSLLAQCQPAPAQCQSVPAQCQSLPAQCQPVPAQCQPAPAQCQPAPAQCQPLPAQCQLAVSPQDVGSPDLFLSGSEVATPTLTAADAPVNTDSGVVPDRSVEVHRRPDTDSLSTVSTVSSLDSVILLPAVSTPKRARSPRGCAASVRSPALSRSSPRQLVKRLREKDGLEQMTLDCGQRRIGAVQCDVCGMTYTHGEPGDEATHSKFHQRLAALLRFPGWKRERVVREFDEGSRVIVVLPDDKFSTKKVDSVRQLIDEELGFVTEGTAANGKRKTFLYISAEKRIVGCCIAETATQGYRVLEGAGATGRPWCCSSEPEPVKCVISRIWVLSGHRRRGVATRLLDSVRSNFLLGYPLSVGEVAFSGPTHSGKALATRYFGTARFLVSLPL